MWQNAKMPIPKPAGKTFLGINRIPAPKPAGSHPESVWLPANPKSASELLKLQSLYGNMGAERVLQSLEPSGKTEPVIQGKWISEKHYFIGQGYKGGLVNCESWDTGINGKVWFRYKPDGIWFYSYQNLGESDETEDQWKTVAEWAELTKPVPKELLEPDVVEKPKVTDPCQELVQSVEVKLSPQLLAEPQWTVTDFGKAMTALQNDGICNALTTAWLMRWLEPGKENQMGFGAQTLKSLLVFKEFLDTVNKDNKTVWGEQSYKVTLAFWDYIRQQQITREWLEHLQSFSISDLDSEIMKVEEFTHVWQDTHPNLGSFAGITDKSSSEKISVEDIRKYLAQVLQPFIGRGIPFKALLVISAWATARPSLPAGHELAFRTSPDGRTVWYYDQNYGLSKEMDIGNFCKDFAEYLYERYVKDPLSTGGERTDRIKFEVIMVK